MSRPPSWSTDDCPPAPFVLLEQVGGLGIARGAAVVPVLGDVHAVGRPLGERSGAATRARAAAMCARPGSGVLVRATAAWVWTGAHELRPAVLDVAVGLGAPALPGPRPGRQRAGLPVRHVHLRPDDSWVVVGGTAVTGPSTTAADCARSLPPPLAVSCVQALERTVDLDLAAVLDHLRRGGARPGRRLALTLLRTLIGPAPPPPATPATAAARQSSVSSRCTPLVTR